MKLKKSDVNLILMAVGIALAAVSYFFVYQKLNEKTDELNASNAKLQKEVDYLQDLADHKQQYLDDTDAMLAEIDNIKSQFPAQYLAEDDIIYVIGVEKDYDSFVENIGMGQTTAIEVAAPAQEQAAPEETTEEDGTVVEETQAEPAQPAPSADILLYRTPVTMAMTTSYNSIKDVIKKINTDKDRKSIETLSLAFDSETGDLTGSLGFSMYSLTGTEAVYETPTISGVVYGTGNIFNSADKKASIQAEKAAEEAANSEEE